MQRWDIRTVGHAVVEQVFGPQLGIDVDQHPVGGLPLAGMTRDRVTMIEVRMLRRIEFDLAASVHLQTHSLLLADAFDDSQFVVGQLQVGRGRDELHTFGDIATAYCAKPLYP